MNPAMKYVFALLSAALCLSFVGCQTPGVGASGTVKGESAIYRFNLEGLKIGDKPSSLTRFAQVAKQPFGRTDYDIYEIYNPNDQISLAIAYFQNNRLVKLEIRYFDGPGIATLARAGGWAGLRDYICSRFGPPSRTGANVPLATDYYGLKPSTAKFNGEWVFSRKDRKLNYIASSDDKVGVGIVTVSSTEPLDLPRAVAPARTTTSTITVRPVPATTSTAVATTGTSAPRPTPSAFVAPKPTPTPVPVTIHPPNPGF